MPFLGKTPSQIVDPEVDIDGGTIDGVSIGSVTANAGAFTNLTATGTLTLPDDGISGDDVNGGTISNFASTGIDDNATSTAITLASNQQIGIGTASPDYTLVVQGDANINDNIFAVKDSDGTRMMSVEQTSNGDGRIFGFDTSGTSQVLLHSNGSSYLNGGNVGIGTTGPSSDAIVRFLHVSNGTSSGLVLEGARKFSIYSSSSSSLAVRDETAGSNRIVLNSSGNVGIGTSSPTGALTVSRSSSDSQINLIRTSSNTANGWIWVNSNKIRFGDDSGGAPNNTRMCVTTDTGNVGIGTTSPLTALHINKASQDNYIRLGSNGANDAGIYFNTATDWTIGTDTSNSNAFDLSNSSTVGGASKVVVTTLGNVGIAGTPTSFGGGVATLQLKGLSSSQPTRAGALRFISNNGTSCDTAIYSDNGFMSFYTGTSSSQNLNLQIDAYGGLQIKSVAGTQAATFGGSNLVNGITALPSSAGTPFVVGRDTGTTRSAWFAGHLKFNSGYGVDFDVSGGSGTVSSNVLDDYEEGTFTAYLGFSGGDSGGLNYTNQTFVYTKVGRMVSFSGFLTWNQNNFTSASGRMYLRGLPFTIISGGSYRGGAGIHYANSPWSSITVYQQEFRSEDGTTDMTFNFADATDGSIDSEITTFTKIALSGNFMVSGTYMTN